MGWRLGESRIAQDDFSGSRPTYEPRPAGFFRFKALVFSVALLLVPRRLSGAVTESGLPRNWIPGKLIFPDWSPTEPQSGVGGQGTGRQVVRGLGSV